MAKSLIIELDEWAIYSGKAVKMLSSAPYDGCTFPLVRKIALFIFMERTSEIYDTDDPDEPSESDGSDYAHDTDSPSGTLNRRRIKALFGRNSQHYLFDADWVTEMDRPDSVGMANAAGPSDIQANVSAFLQRIKQMAPKLGEIAVQPTPFRYPPRSSSSYFGDLVSRLFQLMDRIAYSNSDTPSVPAELQQSRICNLTHITYSTSLNHGPFVQLTQRNALTLQSLVIGQPEEVHLGDFVEKADGSGYIAYPRLLTLKLLGLPEVDEPQLRVFPGVEPFPNLRCIHMDVVYPFGDDTLFRGNAATLKYLKMELDNMACEVFCKYSTFTPTSHPQLQCVDIRFLDADFTPDSIAKSVDCMRFALGIGAQVAVRAIDGISAGPARSSALRLLGEYACIQALSLSVHLDLWEALALIGSLPLLTDLSAFPPQVGSPPTDVTLGELPAYVFSNCAPVSRRFRCWRMVGYKSDYVIEIVRAVLLLALACPNFDYAAPPVGEHEAFMEQMEETIASEEFNS
ncbi:hypothetical protein GGF42_001416 [Coemansia sp. RSA 2424]|nr:hypothetical protein GGF42_001416 [Coemansia sp. RSA 2424]